MSRIDMLLGVARDNGNRMSKSLYDMYNDLCVVDFILGKEIKPIPSDIIIDIPDDDESHIFGYTQFI